MRSFIENNQSSERRSSTKHFRTSTIDSKDISFRNNVFHDQDDLSVIENLRENLKTKEKELSSLTEAISGKKILEQRVIKMQNDLASKVQEVHSLKLLLTKSQDLIIKLRPRDSPPQSKNTYSSPQKQGLFYNDTMLIHDDQQLLQVEDNPAEILVEQQQILIQALHQELEDQRVIDIKEAEYRLREEYEQKFSEVQRKSEEIIKYYRTELQKTSGGSFSGTGPFNSTSGTQNMLNVSIKRTTSHQKIMDGSNEYKQENNTIGTQMIMEAYVEAIGEIKSLKMDLKEIIEKKEAQITNLIEKVQEVNSQINQRIEEARQRESDLSSQILSKEKIIKGLKEIVVELKTQVIEQSKYLQNCLKQLQQRRDSLCLLNDTSKTQTTFYKHILTDFSSMSQQVQKDFMKSFSSLKHQVDFQSSQIAKYQSDAELSQQKLFNARTEYDRLDLSLKVSKQDKSEAEHRLKTIRDRIRDIWQTQCEQYQYDTLAVSAVVDSFTQVIGWTEFISAEMSQQKQKIIQLKDENYNMMMTISNLNDMRGEKSISRNQSVNGSQSFNQGNIFNNDPSAFSEVSFHKQQNISMISQGAVNLRKGQGNQNMLSFQQLKRNELCELLREEIKGLQNELATKNEMVITYKRQLELDQEAFLEKQEIISRLQQDFKTLDEENLSLLQGQASLSEQMLLLKQTLGEKCQECDYLKITSEKDSQAMKTRKEQLIKECKEVKDERDEVRRVKNDLESRLEQANERTEDIRRRENELSEQISRLKARVNEKERQCEQLRREAERVVEMHSQLEAKVDKAAPVMKPAQIQTETEEEHLLIRQENDKLIRDLEISKVDMNQLLQSYEDLKNYCNEQQCQVSNFENEIIRMQELVGQYEKELGNEKSNLQQLVIKEKERRERKRKRKIEKMLVKETIPSTLDIKKELETITSKTHKSRRTRSSSVMNKRENKECREVIIQTLPETHHQKIQTSDQKQVQEQTVQANTTNFFDTDKSFDEQHPPIMINEESCTTIKQKQSRSRNAKSIPRLFNTSECQEPRMISRINTLQIPFTTASNNKENFTNCSFENLPQIIQSNHLQQMMTLDHIHNQVGQKYKRKLKKRVKHIEVLLTHLSGKQQKEDIINRSTKYIEKKHPQLLFQIEQIMQGFINLHQLQYQPYLKFAQSVLQNIKPSEREFLTLSQKLLDLENLILSNNRIQILQGMEDFTQSVTNFMICYQERFISISQQQSQKQTIQSEDLAPSQVRSYQEQINQISPIKEKAIASNLVRIEHKMKEKIQFMDMLIEYIGQQRHLIKSQEQLSIKAEDLAIFLQQIQEFNQQLKVDLSFESLIIGQLLKSLPDLSHQQSKSTANDDSEDSGFLKLENTLALIRQFSFFSHPIDPSTFRFLKEPSDQNHLQISMRAIIDSYDRKYSDLQLTQTIPDFLDRMVFRIRNNIRWLAPASQRSATNTDLLRFRAMQEEVTSYLTDHQNQLLPGLCILQEYLDLRGALLV